jgi:hypothetical protein
MSSLEHKTEKVENETNIEIEAEGLKDSNGSGAVVILFFLIGICLSLAIGWIAFPNLLYSKKVQPIDFDHALHVEIAGSCDSCHFFREDGTFSGVPKLAQCIDCHEEVQGYNPEEEKFVNDYVAQDKEVKWLVYSKQPDCVFFSHAAHVITENMSCEECHGHIGESSHSATYEENKLTGYSRAIWGKNIAGFKKNTWDRMKMDDCGKCHENETGSKGACFQCHK